MHGHKPDLTVRAVRALIVGLSKWPSCATPSRIARAKHAIGPMVQFPIPVPRSDVRLGATHLLNLNPEPSFPRTGGTPARSYQMVRDRRSRSSGMIWA